MAVCVLQDVLKFDNGMTWEISPNAISEVDGVRLLVINPRGPVMHAIAVDNELGPLRRCLGASRGYNELKKLRNIASFGVAPVAPKAGGRSLFGGPANDVKRKRLTAVEAVEHKSKAGLVTVMLPAIGDYPEEPFRFARAMHGREYMRAELSAACIGHVVALLRDGVDIGEVRPTRKYTRRGNPPQADHDADESDESGDNHADHDDHADQDDRDDHDGEARGSNDPVG